MLKQNENTYYAAILTLFNKKGQIDEDGMEQYISFLIDKDVRGFFPCGTSGEYTSLTLEENLKLLNIILRVNRGRRRLIPCASTTNIYTTLELIHRMEKLGIEEVAVCPPFYAPLQQTDILDYYQELLKQITCNIYLYNIPAFTNEIGFSTFERLLEDPRIHGIKDSSGNMKTISRYLAARSLLRNDFNIMVGTDEIILGALSGGCNGSVTAISGIVPEAHNRLYDIYDTDLIEARELQNAITRLAMACEKLVFPVGFKLALEARGFQNGSYRQNIPEKSNPVQYECIKADIREKVDDLIRISNTRRNDYGKAICSE